MKNYCLLGFCELKKNVTKLLFLFIIFVPCFSSLLGLFYFTLTSYTRPSCLVFIVINLSTLFKELTFK